MSVLLKPQLARDFDFQGIGGGGGGCFTGGRHCCPSRSAPTPCRGRLGNLGRSVAALRRHFRTALSFPSLLSLTHDASAHESAAVRRHFAPGAIWLVAPIGLCFRLGRFGGSPFAVGFDAMPKF
jgi:hypothetical protein